MNLSSAQQRILIVNIPPEPLANLDLIINDLNLRVTRTSQIKTHKKQIEEKQYQLILMNLDESGLKDLVKIKRSRKTESIPVIMIDTKKNHEQQLEALRKGACQITEFENTVQQTKLAILSGLNSTHSFNRLEILLNNHKQSLEHLDCASFIFKTLTEAHVLAQTLSLTCLEVNKVAMGLTEILVNAVEHGNLGFSYEDKTWHQKNNTWEEELCKRLASSEYTGKYVTVEVERHHQMIQFTVTDQGTGFDYHKYMLMDPDQADQEHGRGISIARLVAFERLEYQSPGNKVLMYAKSSRAV